MSRDEEVKNPRLFDNRTIERNIRKGLITRKDYEKHLKTLPDVTDKIAPPEAPRSYVAAAPDRDRLDAGDLDDQPRPLPGAPLAAGHGIAPARAGEDEGADADDDDDDDDMSDDTDDLDDDEVEDDDDEDEPAKEPTEGGEEPPRN